MPHMDQDFSTAGDNSVSYLTRAGKGEGICACTSVHWAKKCARLGRKLKSKSEMGNPLAIGAAHVGNLIEITHSGHSWTSVMYPNLGVTGTSVGHGNFGADYAGLVASTKTPYIFSFEGIYKGKPAAHAVAFWKGKSSYAFFDPNYGQYSCSRGSTFRACVPHFINQEYAFMNPNKWWLDSIQA